MKISYYGASIIVISYLRSSVLAFTAPRLNVGVRNTIAPQHVGVTRTSCYTQPEQPVSPQLAEALPKSLTSLLAGATTVAVASSFVGVSGAIAEYVDPDDVGELVTSDLPPVWVPLALGAVLTIGISLLQGSLGDVMNDEAKLGSLSGARAAKQSARDRNMFKKK